MSDLKAADLFLVGIRITGILTVIKAIQVLIITILSLWNLSPLDGGNLPGWVVTERIITLVYPVVLLIIGIYLLYGAGGLVKSLYPDIQQKAFASTRTIFQLAMKIIGVVLIVYALPELLRVISNGLFVGYYYDSGVNTSVQLRMSIERTASTLVAVLLGFYLLYGGRFFEKIAFKNELEIED